MGYVKADGAEGAPNKMVTPASMFGSMGANPNINFLTNANALAAQQSAQQNVAPLQQPQVNAAMGVFGDVGARNRSLYPSALMSHNAEKIKQLQKQIQEAKARGEKYGGDQGVRDYDVMNDVEQDIKAYTAEIKKLAEAHNKETKEK